MGMAVQIFDNRDFGYYKVTIDRPDRRKAKFSSERLAPLRFDKTTLRAAMEYVYEMYGDTVYEDGVLEEMKKPILAWCEDNGIELKAKPTAKLLDIKYWTKLRDMLEVGQSLMGAIGTDEYNDFNQFKAEIDSFLKAQKSNCLQQRKKQF